MRNYGRLLLAAFAALMLLWPLNWLFVTPFVWLVGTLGLVTRWPGPAQIGVTVAVPLAIALVIGAWWVRREYSIERLGLFAVTVWLLLIVVAGLVWPTVDRVFVSESAELVAGLSMDLGVQRFLIGLMYPVAYLLVYRGGYARIKAAARRLWD